MTVSLAILLVAAGAIPLKASDGRAIPATWSPAAKTAPAVILVAEPGRTRADWQPVAEKLAAAGIASLSIELRAVKSDPAEAAPDLGAALAWLRKQDAVDAKKIVIAGAGSAALTALACAASDPKVSALALISSPLKLGEFDGAAALGIYGDRPLFVAVAHGDKPAARAALVFDASAQGAHKIYIAPSGTNGARLLSGDKLALAAFISWISETETGVRP